MRTVEFTLRGADYELTVTGAADVSDGRIAAGAALATITAGGWTVFSVRPVGAPLAPPFASADR